MNGSHTAANDLLVARSGGQAIVRVLRREGVETIFGIVGSHVVDIYDALTDEPTIAAITPRHEVGATFMAAAYARASGKVGVCITTAGPGVLNALNGLGQARFSALPVVMIAGGVPSGARPYELHGLADEEYTLKAARQIAKYATRVSAVRDIPMAIATAFSIARSGRPGPVYVEIPWNLCGAAPEQIRARYMRRPESLARFALSHVEAAAAAAVRTARVALVVDKMVSGQLAPQLRELALERGWAVCTTRDAMNLVPFDDAVFGGILHDHKFGPFAFDVVSQAEICIAIGFDRGSENLGFVTAHARGNVFELCSFDEAAADGSGLTLHEAVHTFVTRARGQPRQQGGPWHQGGAPRAAHTRLLQKLQRDAELQPIHFGYALSRLHLALEGRAIIVHDTGSHEVWARSVLPPSTGRTAFGGANWGTMGHAIPTAAGARVALRDTRVVCITGDGCLLMSLMDLPTLIELGGRTLIVNLNDSEYGMITKVQNKAFGRSNATRLPRADYARVAQEFGATAVRVTEPGMLDRVFADALRSDQPWFIDVVARSDSRYPDFEPRE